MFQNGSFPRPPEEAKEDLFPMFILGIWLNTWTLISQYCWGLPMMGSFGVFNSWTYVHWDSSNSLIIIHIFLS